MTSYDVRG